MNQFISEYQINWINQIDWIIESIGLIELIGLGKTHVRILGVQPEFCREGGGLKRLAKWVVVVLQ